MIKTICSVFFVLSFAFSFSANALSGGGGGMDIGGGSGLALLFRQYGFQVATLIGKTQNFPVTQEQFENWVRTTRVELSEKPVLDSNGVAVAARVNPQVRLITLNILRAKGIFFARTSIMPLVAHVYLEANGYSDPDNQISSKLFKSHGVLADIVCHANNDDMLHATEKITFQEVDHNGDGIADIRSSVAYDQDEKTGGPLNENNPPLINRTPLGVLLVANSMTLLAYKIFLPQEFLVQKSGSQKFDAYFVDTDRNRQTGIYKTFTCDHVDETTSNPAPTPDSDSDSEDKPTDPATDEVIKDMTPYFEKSIRAQAKYVAKLLHLLPGFPLSQERLRELIQKTKIELTNEALFEPGGLEVDALNYPSRNLIRFNFFRIIMSQISPKVMLQLVVHEFLGLAQIPDPSYSVSSRVWELPSVVVTEMTCERQGSSGTRDQIVYRVLDGNGDGVEDTTELFASRTPENGSLQNLQNPFSVVETSDTEIAIVGYHIFWSSEEKSYTTYWKTRDLNESTSFQSDYYEIGQNGYDRFEKPTGTMNCQISRAPKYIY